jgi:hypothetical protein
MAWSLLLSEVYEFRKYQTISLKETSSCNLCFFEFRKQWHKTQKVGLTEIIFASLSSCSITLFVYKTMFVPRLPSFLSVR